MPRARAKSSLLHSLIISSLLKYGPDELQLYLLDFKSGVEFELYSKYKIPQLKLLALDAMQAFGLSVLRELMQQMDERNRLFKGAGVGNIEEYRTTTGYAMPRILVLMDEFQTLFNEDHDRRAARESSVLLAELHIPSEELRNTLSPVDADPRQNPHGQFQRKPINAGRNAK